MKKIVFVSLMMADNMVKKHYPVEGNSFIEFPGEIYYAVNSVLAKTMKADDEIKVILLENIGGDKAAEKNAKLFMNELNELNTCGAQIAYENIPCEFIENKGNFKKVYKEIIKNLENDAELYADITFGPKATPFLIISAMQFGEKFFDCEIGNIVYLKSEFEGGKKIEGSEKICDYTPLYLINSFTNTIECSSGKEALAAVDALFKE